MPENAVDSFRYLDRMTKLVVKSLIRMEKPKAIPWTPLSKPLRNCTVALITTAGIALKSDTPFDQEGEHENPWWGDPSFRVLPRGTTTKDVEIYHLHINPSFVKEDINCLLPLQRLQELSESSEIGQPAISHYAIMGYQLDPAALLMETVPQIAAQMRYESVDVVLLIPAGPLCCWSAGLVQRQIEEAGFTTITLSNVPDLTAAVGVPRLAGIEYPMNRTVGPPGDRETQLNVIRAAMACVSEMTEPGSVRYLPFKWTAPLDKRRPPGMEPPPITKLLMRAPWHLPRLMKRNLPD